MKTILLISLSLIMYSASAGNKDTIIVILNDTSVVKSEIQDFPLLNIYKKRGKKFYADSTKKNRSAIYNKFKSKLSDTANVYVKYYYKKTIVKESYLISDYGDAGLTKTYYPNGQIKSKGVAWHIRKIGYWYYYNRKGELIRIEYHQYDSSPRGVMYTSMLGSSNKYPDLKLINPHNFEIEVINHEFK